MAKSRPSDSRAQADARTRSTARHLLLCIGLAGVLAWVLIRFLVTVPYPLEAELKAGVAPGVRIDPNSAPWWELTALPGIGEVTAKKIVAYRDAERAAHNLEPDEPVFRTLADLQGVRGIGPKKAEAVRDVVVLPAEPDESSRSR